MTEVKTNSPTALLEMPPSNWMLPTESSDSKFFDELMKHEDEYIKNPSGFMARVQDLIDSNKPDKALEMLEVAYELTDKNESRKVATIWFLKAEATQKSVDSGKIDIKTGEKMLDDALDYLNLYEQYDEEARKKEMNYKSAGHEAFKAAEKQYKQANTGIGDIKSVRLPLLDESEKNLNLSNNYFAKARSFQNDGFEFTPAPTKKRGFRLGAKAVLNTFKSSIKSTLNRRS